MLACDDVRLTSVISYLRTVDTVPCSCLNHLVSVNLPPTGREAVLWCLVRWAGERYCLPGIFYQIILQIWNKLQSFLLGRRWLGYEVNSPVSASPNQLLFGENVPLEGEILSRVTGCPFLLFDFGGSASPVAFSPNQPPLGLNSKLSKDAEGESRVTGDLIW